MGELAVWDGAAGAVEYLMCVCGFVCSGVLVAYSFLSVSGWEAGCDHEHVPLERLQATVEWQDLESAAGQRGDRSTSGLELALELAAVRVRVLAPEGLLQRMHDRFRLLASAPDAPAPPVACPLDPAPRKRSVKAAVLETQTMRCARTGNMWI